MIGVIRYIFILYYIFFEGEVCSHKEIQELLKVGKHLIAGGKTAPNRSSKQTKKY